MDYPGKRYTVIHTTIATGTQHVACGRVDKRRRAWGWTPTLRRSLVTERLLVIDQPEVKVVVWYTDTSTQMKCDVGEKVDKTLKSQGVCVGFELYKRDLENRDQNGRR